MFLDAGIDARHEFLAVEGDFREDDDVRRLGGIFTGQGAGSGDPARVTAHDFQDEHLGGGGAHGGDVETGFTGGGGDVLGHAAEARRVVGDRQVVVHGLRHVDGLDRVAHGLGQLGDLQAGIGAVAATVVEEVTDVVGLEHLDQTLVLGTVVLDALELVAAGAEGTARRVAQRGDVLVAFLADVDQVFGQGTDDAVVTGIQLADLVAVFTSGFDDATGTGVDDGGNATGLGVEGIVLGHGLLVSASLSWS